MTIPEIATETPQELAAQQKLIGRAAWQVATANKNNITDVPGSHFKEPYSVVDIDDADIVAGVVMGMAYSRELSDDELLDLEDRLAELSIDGKDKLLADEQVREIVAGTEFDNDQGSLEVIWPEFVQRFKEGTNNGIEQGYLPSYVLTRADEALSKTGVRTVDRVILSNLGDMTAFYDSTKDQVGIDSQSVAFGEDRHIIDSLTHEFLHKIAGGTFIDKGAGDDDVDRPRTGLSSQLSSKFYVRTGINEALTQHIAASILDGDFETIDPDLRPIKDDSYEDYRRILADFVGKSGGIIQIKSLIGAYFEDTEPGVKFSARKQLIAEVTKSYGRGALRKIEALMSTPKYAGADLDLKAYIVAPVLDVDGNVLETGTIKPAPGLFEMATFTSDNSLETGNNAQSIN